MLAVAVGFANNAVGEGVKNEEPPPPALAVLNAVDPGVMGLKN